MDVGQLSGNNLRCGWTFTMVCIQDFMWVRSPNMKSTILQMTLRRLTCTEKGRNDCFNAGVRIRNFSPILDPHHCFNEFIYFKIKPNRDTYFLKDIILLVQVSDQPSCMLTMVYHSILCIAWIAMAAMAAVHGFTVGSGPQNTFGI